MVTPYLSDSTSSTFSFEAAVNYSGNVGAADFLSGGSFANGSDLTSGGAIFAVFSLAPPAAVAVPEPGSLALMGLALLGFLSARRREA